MAGERRLSLRFSSLGGAAHLRRTHVRIAFGADKMYIFSCWMTCNVMLDSRRKRSRDVSCFLVCQGHDDDDDEHRRRRHVQAHGDDGDGYSRLTADRLSIDHPSPFLSHNTAKSLPTASFVYSFFKVYSSAVYFLIRRVNRKVRRRHAVDGSLRRKSQALVGVSGGAFTNGNRRQ